MESVKDTRAIIIKEVNRYHNIDMTDAQVADVLNDYFQAIHNCIKCKESVDLTKLGRFEFNVEQYLCSVYRDMIGDDLTEDEIVINIKKGEHLNYLQQNCPEVFLNYYG